MSKCTTLAGDTWDIIAKRVYGDDHAFGALMDANPEHIETLIFSGGVELEVPEIETESTTDTDTTDAAAWRENML